MINFAYGNEAAHNMKRSYSQIIQDSNRKDKLIPKITKHFEKRMDLIKSMRDSSEKKELYKIKKYLNVSSKVKENLKSFKTYIPKTGEDLDHLINKVEKEIMELDQCEY